MRELFYSLPAIFVALMMTLFLLAMGLAIERMFSLNDWRALIAMLAIGTFVVCAIFVSLIV